MAIETEPAAAVEPSAATVAAAASPGRFDPAVVRRDFPILDQEIHGHPLVYLQMGPTGYADCGYCDRRFILTGGPADLR